MSSEKSGGIFFLEHRANLVFALVFVVVEIADTLGRIIQAFKSITTHGYIAGVKQNQWPQFPVNYGNEIIMNILCAMRMNLVISGNISRTIPKNGIWIGKIPMHSRDFCC